jgi:hypothetical protein
MSMSFYDFLSTAEMSLVLLTLALGVGLAVLAMQRGRQGLLPLMAFVLAIVGILSSRAAVAYVRSGAMGPDPKFLVLGVGNLSHTLANVISYVLIYVALFGPQKGGSP